jgi:hypothetical protein
MTARYALVTLVLLTLGCGSQSPPANPFAPFRQTERRGIVIAHRPQEKILDLCYVPPQQMPGEKDRLPTEPRIMPFTWDDPQPAAVKPGDPVTFTLEVDWSLYTMPHIHDVRKSPPDEKLPANCEQSAKN